MNPEVKKQQQKKRNIQNTKKVHVGPSVDIFNYICYYSHCCLYLFLSVYCQACVQGSLLQISGSRAEKSNRFFSILSNPHCIASISVSVSMKAETNET